MKERQHQQQTPASKAWQKTPFANLIRYVPSDIYFARVRIGGKLIRQSLKTDVLSVAKLRLADFEKAERARLAGSQQAARGKMTFGDALAVFQARIENSTKLKPLTKAYYGQRIHTLKKSWPGLLVKDVRKVTEADCQAWAHRFAQGRSATAYNHTVGILRNVFAVAIKEGARYDNPAESVEWLKEKRKELELPEPAQFERFVETIRTSGGGFARPCGDLVEFLAYGGFRINEARHVTWADCDFTKGEIVVRGDPETGTKNSEIRRVPMIDDMRGLLERIRSDRPDDPPEAGVMGVWECQKAMDRAAKIIGMRRITHHDLRHLFATRCIESGVDIPTVSRWLGHKDGGALAMRTYGHLRDTHSNEMARRVSFKAKQPDNVLELPTAKAV